MYSRPHAYSNFDTTNDPSNEELEFKARKLKVWKEQRQKRLQRNMNREAHYQKALADGLQGRDLRDRYSPKPRQASPTYTGAPQHQQGGRHRIRARSDDTRARSDDNFAVASRSKGSPENMKTGEISPIVKGSSPVHPTNHSSHYGHDRYQEDVVRERMESVHADIGGLSAALRTLEVEKKTVEQTLQRVLSEKKNLDLQRMEIVAKEKELAAREKEFGINKRLREEMGAQQRKELGTLENDRDQLKQQLAEAQITISRWEREAEERETAPPAHLTAGATDTERLQGLIAEANNQHVLLQAEREKSMQIHRDLSNLRLRTGEEQSIETQKSRLVSHESQPARRSMIEGTSHEISAHHLRYLKEQKEHLEQCLQRVADENKRLKLKLKDTKPDMTHPTKGMPIDAPPKGFVSDLPVLSDSEDDEEDTFSGEAVHRERIAVMKRRISTVVVQNERQHRKSSLSAGLHPMMSVKSEPNSAEAQLRKRASRRTSHFYGLNS